MLVRARGGAPRATAAERPSDAAGAIAYRLQRAGGRTHRAKGQLRTDDAQRAATALAKQAATGSGLGARERPPWCRAGAARIAPDGTRGRAKHSAQTTHPPGELAPHRASARRAGRGGSGSGSPGPSCAAGRCPWVPPPPPEQQSIPARPILPATLCCIPGLCHYQRPLPGCVPGQSVFARTTPSAPAALACADASQRESEAAAQRTLPSGPSRQLQDRDMPQLCDDAPAVAPAQQEQ